jgi:type I restriction enzyme M protein
MKLIDISAEEFAGYRLNKGDVLFNRTNSIEHVGKTGLFELDGEYTFASYLVRIVPAPEKILSAFLTHMMNADVFQASAKASATRSVNQANINASKMKAMAVPAPSLPEQEKILSILTKNEIARTQAESVLADAPERKRRILLERLK